MSDTRPANHSPMPWCVARLGCAALLVTTSMLAACASGGSPGPCPRLPDIQQTEDLTPGLVESEYAVAPELLNREEVVRTLEFLYPPLLRSMECGGTVRLWFHILEDGSIEAIRPHTSSGFAVLDFNAQQAGLTMEFSPALDSEGRPIPVWIVLPVEMRTRRR